MTLLRAALAASRLRAWSVAIGRSGLGCHCEKGEPVTARKANHNASNATVVTAGKMVCVSVKYRRPNRWTVQIGVAYWVHRRRSTKRRVDPKSASMIPYRTKFRVSPLLLDLGMVPT